MLCELESQHWNASLTRRWQWVASFPWVSLGHLGSVQCTNTKLCRQHRAVALAEVVACAQCHSARCPCQLHSDERVLSDASLRGAGKLRLLGAARGNKSVHSQFHRRVICVRKNKRMVGESECWTLILMCHWLGLEELYVLFLLQSAGKNVLFVQGIEGVHCESCGYVHTASELFQCWEVPAILVGWHGRGLTSYQIGYCFNWEGEEWRANECLPFELTWSSGCCFCLINLINLICCNRDFNWRKINWGGEGNVRA